MKRRDFICGASCFLAGFALSKFANDNFSQKSNYPIIKKEFNEIYIEVASHCNLNCKGCDAFSPLSKKEFVTYDDLVRDFTQLKELFPDRNIDILFLGGEPLLNPELTKMVEFTRELFPNGKNEIMTNGILLAEMDETFWKTLARANTKLRITKHPIYIDRSIAEKQAEKYGVEIEYDIIKTDKLYDLYTKQPVNNEVSTKILTKLEKETCPHPWGKPVIDLRGSQNWKDRSINCIHKSNAASYCRGNIYYCWIHSHLNAFIDYFKLDMKINKDSYLKVSDITTAKEIEDFISSPNKICRFCKQCHNICFEDKIIDWDFSKRELSEWT